MGCENILPFSRDVDFILIQLNPLYMAVRSALSQSSQIFQVVYSFQIVKAFVVSVACLSCSAQLMLIYLITRIFRQQHKL